MRIRAIALVLLLSLAACSRASDDERPSPVPATGTAPPTTATIVPTPLAPTALPATPAGTPFSDDAATQLMYTLSGRDQDAIAQATERIVTARDTRFIAVFLELMRADQIGITEIDATDNVAALETLSGQTFGDDYFAWVEWYGQTDLAPPPGFTGWKGDLLGRIDPGFDDFLQDEFPSRIRVEEIQWGGVRIDGIPPLENPPTLSADEAVYLRDDDAVFGVVADGAARAYPLRIVDNHEMVNDVLGGVPLSLAYCTLCGAAIPYDGRGPAGETYTFGTSGFLYRSNKLMYDRNTRTLWNQLTGQPVLGELADTDIRLDILPVVLTTWAEWQAQHPDTTVLDIDTGVYPPGLYQPAALYGHYFSSDETMFPVWQRSDLLEDKAFVYTLFVDGVPKAYAVDALAEAQVVNDTLGETPLVLIAPGGTVTVQGESRYAGPVRYSSGGEVRAYNRGEETFAPGPNADTVLDGSGRAWQVTEAALIGPDGEEAPRVNGHLAYWFGWYAFFPNTLVYPSPN